jgi:Protein of unknown function (DUF4235)
MAGTGGRLAFKVVSMAVAIPVSKAITKASTKAWQKARPEDPPHDPKSVQTNWRDAIIWALLTGLGTAVAQVLSTKGADTVWRAATGKPSPKPKPKLTKEEKKAQKQAKAVAA